MIHIGRAGTKLGAFSEDEVRQGLVTGRFSPTDLGWKEGMANWAPLSQFSELAEPPPLPVEAPPEPGPAEPIAPAGLPWDDRRERGLVVAFAKTVRLVLLSSSQAFASMRTEGSLTGPLLFNMIGGWIGLIAMGVYGYISVKLHPADLSALHLPPGSPLTTPAGQRMMFMAGLKMFVVMGPVIVTAAALASSLIIHLLLMLTGGANNAFHVTLRVFCFSAGSAMLVLLVPFYGLPIAMIWPAACCASGLASAHKTTMGRSVVAMVLFVVAWFVCYIGAIALALAVTDQLGLV